MPRANQPDPEPAELTIRFEIVLRPIAKCDAPELEDDARDWDVETEAVGGAVKAAVQSHLGAMTDLYRSGWRIDAELEGYRVIRHGKATQELSRDQYEAFHHVGLVAQSVAS